MSKKIYENGQIIVATQTIKASCGAIRVHKGAIVKVAEGTPDSYDEIKVWKSKNREDRDLWNWADYRKFRPATEKESQGYEKYVRNAEHITT
jgi:hypothetical protein